MRWTDVRTYVAGLLALSAARAYGDGAMFLPVHIADSVAAGLAQTRQEAVLAIHPYEAAGTPVAPPDACLDALPICISPGESAEIVFAETALSAATNDGTATCGGTAASPDVWLSYTPLREGDASLVLWVSPSSGDTWQTDDVTLSVYSGCPGNDSDLVACSAPSAHETNWSPTVSFPVESETTYYIRVAMVPGTPARIEGLAVGRGAPETTSSPCTAPTEGQSGPTAVTYVLRTHYRGEPSALAWVVPVPATPLNVLAHADARLFDQLAQMTEPQFDIMKAPSGGSGCGCGGALGTAEQQGGLVNVESRGTAGILDWAALTSSGADALLTWLNENDFDVPAEAASILDTYIAQDMHFLAVRINAPEQLTADATGAIDIPPLQFTCVTSQVFYPMAISRISAADPTEVLLYLMGYERMEAANLPNGVIDPNALAYDPNSPSLTNYESLFTDTIAELGGAALITEYANLEYGLVSPGLTTVWPDAPAGTDRLDYLTRLRTVLPRERMDQDFEFQAAASNQPVSSDFTLTVDETAVASLLGDAAVVAGLYGVFCQLLKRRAAKRRSGPAA